MSNVKLFTYDAESGNQNEILRFAQNVISHMQGWCGDTAMGHRTGPTRRLVSGIRAGGTSPREIPRITSRHNPHHHQHSPVELINGVCLFEFLKNFISRKIFIRIENFSHIWKCHRKPIRSVPILYIAQLLGIFQNFGFWMFVRKFLLGTVRSVDVGVRLGGTK